MNYLPGSWRKKKKSRWVKKNSKLRCVDAQSETSDSESLIPLASVVTKEKTQQTTMEPYLCFVRHQNINSKTEGDMIDFLIVSKISFQILFYSNINAKFKYVTISDYSKLYVSAL